jgi:hypothetical protein
MQSLGGVSLTTVEDGGNPENRSEVAFELLADWWMSSVQALVDSVGSEKALRLLQPHYRNAGIAGESTIKATFGLNQKDLINASACQKIAYDILTRGKSYAHLEIREFGCILRKTDCPFKDGPLELCDLVCGTMPNAAFQFYDSEHEWVTTSRSSQGAPACIKVLKPKSFGVTFDLGQLGEMKAEILPREIPKCIVDDFSIQYLAELWVISTRGFIEHFGNKRTTSILRPYMKLSGTSFGLRCLRSAVSATDGIETVNEFVGLCNDLLQMKGDGATIAEGGWDRTITECPFKDTSPEVCDQFESFCNGGCEAIDPDYEFAYDRMMTKGDKSCHWVIRKKDARMSEINGNKASSEDPSKILAIRFARGDLSEEEFDSRMTKLRQYGLGK